MKSISLVAIHQICREFSGWGLRLGGGGGAEGARGSSDQVHHLCVA